MKQIDSSRHDYCPLEGLSLPTILKKGRVVNLMAGDHEVLTLKEICELLRVHPSTVYKMIRQGKVPSFRIGTDWRFRTELVERWMAEKSMQSRQVEKSHGDRHQWGSSPSTDGRYRLGPREPTIRAF
jgi:excisionase family DNA binding protein